MDSSWLSNASATPPSAPATSGGYPTAGSKITGIPATVPGPYWFYSITEELKNVVKNSGQTPDSTDLEQVWKAILLTAHPVGSIYMSVDSTSPATLFGGTWVAIQDRMLVGAGNNFGVLTEGGESSHTLTVSELPSHTHSASSTSAGAHTHTRGSMDITGQFAADSEAGKNNSGAFYSAGTNSFSGARNDEQGHYLGFKASNSWSGSTSSAGAHSHTVTVSSTGGGASFNTMSPYLAVYMWRRTA